MGQCQYCRRPSNISDAASPQKGLAGGVHESQDVLAGRHSGSDSALDSGHSCCDEGSCGGGGGGEQARSSHSSESSGKYSLRESTGSSGDCERPHSNPEVTVASGREAQALPLGDDDAVEGTSGLPDEDALRPLQDVARARKVSRGSTCSERGSVTSVSSVTAVLKARLGRSISLKVRRPRAESETLYPNSPEGPAAKHRRRAVSLRLPRSHQRPQDADTNLPTIYVEESPRPKGHQGREFSRKSSLRRALSLLSMNSLRQETAAAAQQQQQRPQKPVQKILRRPRRRHTTVRGLSGMAIDSANHQQVGLQRSSTLYYPTAASLRHAYAARRTYSDNQS